jgi:hypothetical protein
LPQRSLELVVVCLGLTTPAVMAMLSGADAPAMPQLPVCARALLRTCSSG